MLKMIKIAGRFELWALASVAFTMSACGVFWAGGVDEETNTVAAADPAPNVTGQQESVASDEDLAPIVDSSKVIKDPIEVQPVEQVSASPINTQPSFVVVDEPAPGNSMPPVHSFTGKLDNTNGETLDITVSVSGSNVKTTTDASGYFVLQNLPIGIYPMVVSSGNSSDVAYLLKNDEDADLFGPIPSSAISTVKKSDLEVPELQTFHYKDEVTGGYPDPSPEPIPEPESSASDVPSEGSSSSQVAYQSADSIKGPLATNTLPHSFDYGVMKEWSKIANGSTEEDSNNDYYWYMEWTVEASFELSSVDSKNMYHKNIFGKFDADGGVMMLAIINGECGTEAPSFALYVARYGNFSCNDAVISTAAVKTGKKIALTGTYDGETLKLYKDGFEIAENTLRYYAGQDFSTAPFVFGDTEMDMTLSDVRLGEKAITSADVLYRYYQQGGAQ